MAYFIDVPRFDDGRGSLCVLEDILPFSVKRIYYIFISIKFSILFFSSIRTSIIGIN